jgi:hypothetical protein
MATKQRPHNHFTEDEWEDLDRTAERLSAAMRAKSDFSGADMRAIETIYAEERDAAADRARTLDRVLAALRERANRR